jgi:hypothetical protein
VSEMFAVSYKNRLHSFTMQALRNQNIYQFGSYIEWKCLFLKLGIAVLYLPMHGHLTGRFELAFVCLALIVLNIH